MKQMVKTTIVLPEAKLQKAKLKAVREKTTLSRLIDKGLDLVLSGVKQPPKLADKGPEPTHRLGVFKLGIKKGETFHRRDMYDDYLKRKMGY